jgi:alkaline phosphatase D
MLSRRKFLGSVIAGSTAACAARAPALQLGRPWLTHGVQAGDVGGGRATVWARGSEPGLLEVEWDTVEQFKRPNRVPRVALSPLTDFTATALLTGLPDEQTIWYRVRLSREAARGVSSWSVARFATPSERQVRFTWSGDTCGQGFGINDQWGGLRAYEAMRRLDPAFFIHCGDLMYADNPILPELVLGNGRIWKNRSTPRVARVAEELDDFRARFAYNFEDENVRRLAAEVPIVATWDDHETHNNWWPGQRLSDERYGKEREVSRLAAMARQATLEWTPIQRDGSASPKMYRWIPYGPLLDVIVLDLRAYRAGNDGNRGERRDMLGAEQRRWFLETMSRSTASWRVVVCSQPLGLVVPDGELAQEGWANGAGPPLGRELELASILEELHRRRVGNVVWLTADVHYAAAHHYDPARTQGLAFTPFWEFVGGPIHAGAFGPNPLDPTFGPKVMWQKAVGEGMGAPWDDYANFGSIEVFPDGVHVRQHGVSGEWWSMTLDRQG